MKRKKGESDLAFRMRRIAQARARQRQAEAGRASGGLRGILLPLLCAMLVVLMGMYFMRISK